MPRFLLFVLSAAALASCSRSIEGDVVQMCTVIVDVIEGEVYSHVAVQDRDSLVMEAMAESIRTSELISLIGELGEMEFPARQGAVAEFASTHGFVWDCPEFDRAFLLASEPPTSPEPPVDDTAEDAPTPPNEGSAVAPADGSSDSAPGEPPVTGSREEVTPDGAGSVEGSGQ